MKKNCLLARFFDTVHLHVRVKQMFDGRTNPPVELYLWDWDTVWAIIRKLARQQLSPVIKSHKM